MLFRRVERPRNRIILGLVRPISLEYFVGLATEYKLSIFTIETCRRKIHCFVSESEGPTTYVKFSVGSSSGPPGACMTPSNDINGDAMSFLIYNSPTIG